MDVKWRWIKKSYGYREAEIKLYDPAYVLLGNVGDKKMIGFKIIDENFLPVSCEYVIDPYEIKECEGHDLRMRGGYGG